MRSACHIGAQINNLPIHVHVCVVVPGAPPCCRTSSPAAAPPPTLPCSRFVRLRRFEHMSVHQAMQGLRVSGFPWLQPRQGQSQSSDAGADPAPGDPAPGDQQDGGQQRRGRAGEASLLRPLRLCASQHASQQRMLALWLGWLFSVLVVPLLRAHFYCTESEAYRQQVFYYR